MTKRPSFQFYPGDWLRNTALRSCSIGARGLWVDMVCLMHEGEPYGHLKVKNKVIDDITLARMVGGEVGEVKEWLRELEDSGVFFRNEEGCIYSRRMVRDESFREIRAAGGKLGGNPKITTGYNKPGFVYAMLRSSDGAVKIGISQDPSKRLYKIKQQYPSSDFSIMAKLFVDDMDAKETELHQFYSSKKDGEWFFLDKEELNHLLNFHLKANAKEKPKENSTPSSSSSSALLKKEKPPSEVKRKGKTFLPENLKISDKHRELANTYKLDVVLEFEKFKARNEAAGAQFVNWDAAFRNWLHKAHEFKTKPQPNGGSYAKYENSAAKHFRENREALLAAEAAESAFDGDFEVIQQIPGVLPAEVDF